MAQGIEPNEARARIDSLPDDEVIDIADKIDQLPAGSGAVEVRLVILLAGFMNIFIHQRSSI